jgi:hypothetical protein
MKTLGLIAVALLMLCGNTFAQTVEAMPFVASGNSFLRDCSVVDKEKTAPIEDAESVACLFYVGGVVRGAELGSAATRGQANQTTLPQLFCRPGNVEVIQLVRIVLKHIRQNPENANQETAILILRALREAYPCPSK